MVIVAFSSGFPSLSRIAALVRLRYRQRSAGSCQRAPSTADSPFIPQFRRLLGRKLSRAWSCERVRFAEIIGVVLDGDAPCAPAGIPTCRNAAFVSAPAGIFLTSQHRAADLSRLRFRCRGGFWRLTQSCSGTESRLRSCWAPRLKLRRRCGDINKIWTARRLACSGSGSGSGGSERIHGKVARFICRISAWQAWRISRRCP